MPAHASRARTVAPYGSWKSPITAESLVANAVGLEQITLDGDVTYWVEMRPSEGGRNVIVRRDAQGKIADMTPQPFNARTRVHEYGGRSYVVAWRYVYFSNFADQRIYRVAPAGRRSRSRQRARCAMPILWWTRAQAADLRARGPRRERPRGDQHAGQPRPGGANETAARSRQRATTSTRRRGSVPTARGSPG